MPVKSGYTEELAEYICEQIAEKRALRTICKEEGMPKASTVCDWLREHADFAERYARARELQADAMAEEIIEIADNCTDDIMFLTAEDGDGEGGKAVIKHSSIARAKVQIDARKWYAGKLRPQVYGDKLHMAGDKENPIQYTDMTEAELDAKIAELEGRIAAAQGSQGGADTEEASGNQPD